MRRILGVDGDPYAELTKALRLALAANPAPYTRDVVIGTRIPRDRNPADNPPPLVVVRPDGGPIPISGSMVQVPVRLAVWASTDDNAYDLAMAAHAITISHHGRVIRQIQPTIMPYVAADPDTGEPLAAANMNAYARPKISTNAP